MQSKSRRISRMERKSVHKKPLTHLSNEKEGLEGRRQNEINHQYNCLRKCYSVLRISYINVSHHRPGHLPKNLSIPSNTLSIPGLKELARCRKRLLSVLTEEMTVASCGRYCFFAYLFR